MAPWMSGSDTSSCFGETGGTTKSRPDTGTCVPQRLLMRSDLRQLACSSRAALAEDFAPSSCSQAEMKRPTHLALLAGTDFFTAEVLTLRGLVTYYVLFFIHLESRLVDIAGITIHPDEPWMRQIARNVTMEGCGTLRDCRYLLHDRDTKYTLSFRAIIVSGRVEPLVLPARSPNLNAYAERWVRSVKEEALSR